MSNAPKGPQFDEAVEPRVESAEAVVTFGELLEQAGFGELNSKDSQFDKVYRQLVVVYQGFRSDYRGMPIPDINVRFLRYLEAVKESADSRAIGVLRKGNGRKLMAVIKTLHAGLDPYADNPFYELIEQSTVRNSHSGQSSPSGLSVIKDLGNGFSTVLVYRRLEAATES